MSKAVKAAVQIFVVTFLVVSGLASLGMFATGVGIAGSIAAFAAEMAALSSVSVLVGGLLSKGSDAVAENFGSKISTRSPTNPRQIIYGKARVGGTITHVETSGTDNHKLSMIVSLAGHELESLDEILINDISVTSTSVGLFQYATNTKFKNTDNDNKFDANGTLLRYKFIDGSQTTADSSVTANTSLTTSDKFIDVAYVFIEMVFDSEAFGGGIPPMSFVVKGKKVFDPRDSNQTFGTESTYTWSDNPALCILDYITNTTYGLKATADEINTSTALGSFKVAANNCDIDTNTITTATVNGAVSGTQVTLDISNSITLIDVGQIVTGTGIVGTVKVASRDGNIIKLSSAQTIADGTTLTIKEKSYTANGITNMSADGGGVIEGLLSSCAGKLSYIDGKFVMFAGVNVSPSLTITDENILQPITVQNSQNSGETFNQVKAVYIDANNNYVPTDSPLETTVNPATSNTFLSEDTPTGEAQANYKKTLEVQLPFTDTSTMAQRLQRTALLHTRKKTSITVVCNIAFMQLQPFDWVYLTNERLGYTNKTFEVLSTNLEIIDNDGVPVIATRLALKEIDNSVYNFASTSYTNPLDEGSSVSTGSFSVSSPTGLSVSATLINTGYDLNVQWTNIADDNIQGTEILYGTSSGAYTGSVITGKGISKEIINNVKPNTTYYIVARHFSNNNVFSAKTSEVTINTNSGTGITTPSAPTSLSATTGKPLSIGLSWTNPSNSDLRDIQIYRSTSNGFTPDDSSNLVRTIAGVPSVAQKVSFGIDDGLVAGTTYYFKVKAVSFFDKVSTASSQASGSFTKVEATDIEGIFSGYFHVEGSTTTALSDSAFNTAHGRLPIEDDILIMVNTSASPKVSKAYKYSGTAGSGGSFVEINNFQTGDLVVDGTIAGSKIIAGDINADRIEAGTLTSDSGVFGSISADDIDTGTLDAANVTISGGDVTINSSGIAINGSQSSINLGSGNFIVSSAGSITSTSGTIGGFTLGSTSLTAGSNTTRVSLSTADGIHLGSNTFSSAPFKVTRAGELTATNANVTGDLETDNLVVTGNAGIHGEVRATSLTAGTVTVSSINQEVWNEIDARTAPTQNGFYDNYDSTSTGTYYNGVATNFELLGSGGNGYLSNGQSISIRTSMVHGYAQQGSQTYTGDALKATFQFQYKTLPSGNWTNFGSAYVGVTDAYTIPNGFFYELDADPDASVNLSNGVYYQFRLRVTPTVTNNVWADSDANDVFAIAFAIQQSSTGTGAGTGTVTSVGSGDGLSGGPITGSGTLTVDSTVVRTSGVQTLGGNKTFSDNVVIQGDLDVQGTTTTIDTANLDVKDKNITLNYSTGDSSASANGAGITIQDAVSVGNDATILWNTNFDNFDFSHTIRIPDSQKVEFGADADLQIYHESGNNHSVIKETGTGNLKIQAANIEMQIPNGTQNYLQAINGGAVTLYNNGSPKIATTSSGIDVTGTVTSDGLTVDGTTNLSGATLNGDLLVQKAAATITVKDSNDGGTVAYVFSNNSGNTSSIRGASSSQDIQIKPNEVLSALFESGGDISFYDDTGTSQNLKWDSSADTLNFVDNAKATFGTGNDLQIYHDGSNSNYIKSTTSDIYLRNEGDNDKIYIQATNSGTLANYLTIDGSSNDIKVHKNLHASDNIKSIFGSGNDLQIYHDGSNSYIDEAGDGVLFIKSSAGIYLNGKTTDEPLARFIENGAVNLYYDNYLKFNTTSTGIDVTGTVTADGLTVDGTAQINGTSAGQLTLDATGQYNQITFEQNSGNNSGGDIVYDHTNDQLWLRSLAVGSVHLKTGTTAGNTVDRLKVASNGDISFYEDTGTTAKFFWDASAERLAVGHSSPLATLDIDGDVYVRTGHTLFTDILRPYATTTLTIGQGTNDIAKFTGSIKIGNSTIVDSSRNLTNLGTISTSVAMGSSPTNIIYMAMSGNNTNGGGGAIRFDTSASNADSSLYYASVEGIRSSSGNGSNELHFFTTKQSVNNAAPTRKMTIDEDGNVGIGIDSFTNKLNVDFSITGEGSQEGGIKIQNSHGSNNDIAPLYFGVHGGTRRTKSAIGLKRTGSYGIGDLIFALDSNGDDANVTFSSDEKMRLNNSGNLLVGTTDTSVWNNGAGGNTGTVIESDGTIQLAKSNNITAYFNRLDSDGDIVSFRKNGSSVGSIGTMNFGDMYLGTDDTGIYFNNGIDSISPINTTNQTVRDNAIDLGASNARFKDLYLSGTISSGAITSTSSITANSGGNVIQIGTDGNIEITRTSGGAYIDFKDSSSEDYDQRLQATSSGHSFSGDVSVTNELNVGQLIYASGGITTDQSGQMISGFTTIRVGDALIGQDVATLTTTSASQTNRILASATTYRTLKVIVQIKSSTNFHATEILLTHNGTTVYMTEYATIFSNNLLATFDADISGGNIRLLIDPNQSVSTEFKFNVSGIEA